MRFLGTTALLVASAALAATVLTMPGPALADDCPVEKRKVCVQETIAGQTFTHEARTNECLVAKWTSKAKILNDGACK